MNDKTAQVIQQLADKLGTTSKYLWEVLLRQAHISATITLIQDIIILLFGVSLYNLHKHFSKQRDLGDSYQESLYEKSDDVLPVIMVCATIVWVVFIVIAFFYIDDIINGYFNPEYWALNHILDKID